MTKTVSFLSDKASPRKKIELTLDQKREICLFYVENSKCGNKVKQKDLVAFSSVVESIYNLFKFNQEKECLSEEDQFNAKQATLDNFVNIE
ncbi:hypothetical protein BpHYR1_011539 [Brachionus plicatilis]|uniref:Uncharacterized protein n=1 Tax=Brachionus plicatilis TaxID=10195 RepID=A0A3M7QZ89_BRAPC|nr:hypothetical protein BpHYR1_011539 [Brachionus plicatilis]